MDQHWNSKGERRVYLSHEELQALKEAYFPKTRWRCYCDLCASVRLKLDEALGSFDNVKESFGE